MKDEYISKEEIKKLAPPKNRPKFIIEDNAEPVRIHVHPDLEGELKFWKVELERISGYVLDGGKPTVSKVLAYMLKEFRTKNAREEKRIVIEIHKMIGVKRAKIVFL